MTTRLDPHLLAEVRRLRAEGATLGAIAKALGVTRGAVSGMVARHVLGRHWALPPPSGAPTHKRRRLWTEESLTEPYALRKIRRAKLKDICK